MLFIASLNSEGFMILILQQNQQKKTCLQLHCIVTFRLTFAKVKALPCFFFETDKKIPLK